jgi:hypothetical protein
MNAVARGAIEKFGELPQEIFDGTRRSRFAPPLVRRPAAGRAESSKGDAGQPDGEESGTAPGEAEALATDDPGATDGASA